MKKKWLHSFVLVNRPGREFVKINLWGKPCRLTEKWQTSRWSTKHDLYSCIFLVAVILWLWILVDSGYFVMKFHPPRESVLSTRFLYNKGGCASSLFQVWYWHKSSWNSAIGIHPKSMNQSWLSTKHTQLVGSIYLPLQGTKISHLGKEENHLPSYL